MNSDAELQSRHMKQVLAFLAAVDGGNAELAMQLIDRKRFQQHTSSLSGGEEVEGSVEALSRGQDKTTVVRALEDGTFVLTHSKGETAGQEVLFDLFRLEDELIVEHWHFATADAAPNLSGHTQTDGPVKVQDLEHTEQNTAFVRDYYGTVHVGGEHEKIPQYFRGDHCIRHEPGVRDGVAAFMLDLERLIQNRTIDSIEVTLGQGDFVLIAANGTVNTRPCVYLDLYRVEAGKIAERWGFPVEAHG